MNVFKALFFVVFAVLLFGCNKLKKEQNETNTAGFNLNKRIGVSGKNAVLYFMSIKNHDYIMVVRNWGNNSQYAGMVHDPDCECKKK